MISQSKFLALAAVAGLVLGVAALASPSLRADRQESESPTRIVSDAPTSISAVPPEADPKVKDALVDGVVTREEYDQAVANTVACLDDKGVQHTEPTYDESRSQYAYTVVNTTGINGLSPHDECWMRYERDIQSAWVSQNSGGPPQDVKSWSRALACAYTFGVEGLRDFEELLALWESGLKDSRPEMHKCIEYGLGATSP